MTCAVPSSAKDLEGFEGRSILPFCFSCPAPHEAGKEASGELLAQPHIILRLSSAVQSMHMGTQKVWAHWSVLSSDKTWEMFFHNDITTTLVFIPHNIKVKIKGCFIYTFVLTKRKKNWIYFNKIYFNNTFLPFSFLELSHRLFLSLSYMIRVRVYNKLLQPLSP